MTAPPSHTEPPDEFIETVDRAGCARLLAAVDVGRLAVVAAGRPRIVVLNYHFDGADVFFRTREDAFVVGLTADDAAVHAEFEVDSAFAPAESGWSVIASGLLVREQDARKVAAARDRVRAWAQGERDVVLRLDVADLSGRRVGRL